MVGIDLKAFYPLHAADLKISDSGTLIFSDKGGWDLHLLRMEDHRINGVRVHANFVCRIEGGPDAAIHVNHFGGKFICVIGHDGTIVENGLTEKLTVSRDSEGWLTVDLIYPSGTVFFALGLSKSAPILHHWEGDGSRTCELKHISLTPLPFGEIDESERVVYVDVGARGGLPTQWAWIGSKVRPIMFEPAPIAAEKLKDYIDNFPGGQLWQVGLFNETGDRTLYVTREAGCSSLRPPNEEMVAHCLSADFFRLVGEEIISVTTYSEMYKAGKVPQPDVIKIDVQGCEFEVLEGFGDLLEGCIGIELETHISPLYQGEKLLTDIVAFLDKFGFDLVELSRAGHYDRLLEFDAQFLENSRWRTEQAPNVQAKYDTVREVWGIR